MKRLLFTLATVLCALQLQAQVQTVTFGNSTASNSNAGPLVWNVYSPTEYYAENVVLYTQAELQAAGIPPGAVIASLQFKKAGTAVLANGATAAVNLYFRSGTANTAYSNTDILSNVVSSGFVPAGTFYFDDNQNNLPTGSAWIPFILPAPYTYTGGNLEVYTTSAISPGTGAAFTPGSLTWTTSAPNTTVKKLHISGATPGSGSTQHQVYRGDVIITFSNSGVCVGKPSHALVSSNIDTLCEGGSYVLSAINTSQASNISFQWQSSPAGSNNFSNIQGATATTYTGSATQPTTYRLITHCDASGIDDTSNTVTVTILPIPQFAGITEVHNGLSYNFAVQGIKPGMNITWHYGDGNSGTANNYTYAAAGSYTVKVVGANQCGKDSATLTINAAPVAVQDMNGIAKEIQIYPNPARDMLYIAARNKSEAINVKILDAKGSTVSEKSGENGSVTLSLRHLAGGVYFCIIQQGGSQLHYKLIKE